MESISDSPVAVPLPSSGADAPAPVAVTWIGDSALAQRFTARRAPHIQISELTALAAIDQFRSPVAQIDIVVVDASGGIDPLALIRLVGLEGLDLPVLLLVEPGHEDLRSSADRLAVCDVLVKTPDFTHQLLASFAQLRARHELHDAYRASRQTEERFRKMLEIHPAVTCLIGADGTVAAMNQSGLGLAGVSREEIVGRPFTNLLPYDQQPLANDFIGRVCRGEATTGVEHTLLRGDGIAIRVHVDAVPLQRPDGFVALTTLRELLPAADTAPVALTTAPETNHVLIAELEAERDHLQQALQAATHRCEALAGSLAQTEGRTRELESRLWQIQNDHTAAISEREQTDRDSCTKIDALTADISVLSAECERLRAQADAAANDAEARAALATRLADAEATALAAAQRSSIDAESLAALQQSYEQLVTSQQASDEQRFALEATHVSERARWASDADTMRTEQASLLVSFEQERSALNSTQKQLTAEREQLRLECDRLATDLQQALLRQDEQATAKVQAESSATRQATSHLERLLDDANARCLYMVEELSTAKLQLAQADEQTAALQTELNIANQSLAVLPQLRRAVATDQRMFIELRQELIRTLCDVDQRRKAIVEEQASVLNAIDSFTR